MLMEYKPNLYSRLVELEIRRDKGFEDRSVRNLRVLPASKYVKGIREHVGNLRTTTYVTLGETTLPASQLRLCAHTNVGQESDHSCVKTSKGVW
eukprot:1727875-Amphidinium_carterae.1